MEEKMVYILNTQKSELINDDIPDIEFIEKGRKMTIEELIYNLNRDLINIELNWFRII
jgi:hypothetical protein